MQKLFISYSRKDIDFVRKLAEDLEKAGYDVWWDLTDLQGGDDWPRAIPAAIEASQTFIIVLSPNSTISDWVEKEYTHALSLRKKIIPVMLQRASIPFALNTINYVDFTSEDYTANFNNLLTALGHTGERPVITPPIPTLPMMLRKYAIPIGIGAVILLGILATLLFSPTPPPETPTPSVSPTSAVVTFTNTVTVTPTITLTATSTPATETPTPSPTSPTPTPTLSRTFPLPICIYYPSVPGVYVREAPSNNTGSDPLGMPLKEDGSKCPVFSARIENEENEIWFQVASHQTELEFAQYANGWIYGHLLAAFDLPRRGNLPLCIYSRSVGTVYIRDVPSEFNYNTVGSPLEANGSKCPFFNERQENEEGIWFRFAPDQKGKVDFKQYANGWIPAQWLAGVDTSKLPLVTLTPTSLPSNTPTVTPTFTRTPTLTPSNTPTITPTFTRTPTDTPTPTDSPIPTATQTETPLSTETPTPE